MKWLGMHQTSDEFGRRWPRGSAIAPVFRREDLSENPSVFIAEYNGLISDEPSTNIKFNGNGETSHVDVACRDACRWKWPGQGWNGPTASRQVVRRCSRYRAEAT